MISRRIFIASQLITALALVITLVWSFALRDEIEDLQIARTKAVEVLDDDCRHVRGQLELAKHALEQGEVKQAEAWLAYSGRWIARCSKDHDAEEGAILAAMSGDTERLRRAIQTALNRM